ncbi:MAG: hypothetical protein FWG98_01235 [Candidatus Cloacimonetes bacterium]|nr:hypothetical protein [Candidatus Cloacimonadota bacterium]
MKILHTYPFIDKVGPALKINDLPKTKYGKWVENWEKQFWADENIIVNSLGFKIYHSNLDTTFALYKPRRDIRHTYNALRVADIYTALHLPWYIDEVDKETEQYLETSNHSSTFSKLYNSDFKPNYPI